MNTIHAMLLPSAARWLGALGVWCSLLTLTAADERPARLALLSDTHITRGTNDTQPFHARRFAQAIAAVNAAQVDLVLIAGDLTEEGTREELADFRELMRKFQAPVWYVPGNHDVGGKQVPGKPTAKDTTRERLQAYERQMGQSWFIREQAGVRIIGLNGSLLGSGFPEEQAMWDSVSLALAAPVPSPTLLMTHYPLYAEKRDEPGGAYWNMEPGPRERFIQLIEQGGVRAILSGHLHKEILRRDDGRLFVTTPPICRGSPPDRQYRGWTLLTVPRQGPVESEFRYLVD